jgi:DNA-binding response OmpR family regulator
MMMNNQQSQAYQEKTMTRINPLILIVEDRAQYVRLITVNLEQSGYEVINTDNAEDAIAMAARYQPDLILLDIQLVGAKTGLDACREIRRFLSVPIMMISVWSSTEDIVKGLDAGADDYISKPFSAQELMARVRAQLRRATPEYGMPDLDSAVFEVGRLKVDFGQQRVYVDEQEKKLPPVEYRLLVVLVRNAGKIIPSLDLLEEVWDFDQHEPQLLWQAIHRLRSQIEPDPHKPQYIHTRPGIGYVFSFEPNDDDDE